MVSLEGTFCTKRLFGTNSLYFYVQVVLYLIERHSSDVPLMLSSNSRYMHYATET